MKIHTGTIIEGILEILDAHNGEIRGTIELANELHAPRCISFVVLSARKLQANGVIDIIKCGSGRGRGNKTTYKYKRNRNQPGLPRLTE